MTVFLIANSIVILALAFLFYRKASADLKIYFWAALILKLIAGVAVGLIYFYYYKVGDTLYYFHDAVVLADYAGKNFSDYLEFLWSSNEASPLWASLNFGEPRALFLVKVASLFALLTHNNYWLMANYCSAISFIGAWFFVESIKKSYPSYTTAAVIAFLFFPSVVFWSSGLIKESLSMGALYFISAIVVQLWNKKRVTVAQVLIGIVALYVLWNLKYYYLAVFLPVTITGLVLKLFIFPYFKVQSRLFKILLWTIVFLVPLYVASIIHPNFYPERFLDVIVSNNNDFNNISEADDLIYYQDLQPTVWSVLMNAPQALASGLFRPFLWEGSNVFKLAIAIENTFLMLLLVWQLISIKKLLIASDKLLLGSVILYIVLLCIFLALSTPNFGTLSRYRVGFLPFFVMLLLLENPVIMKRKYPSTFGSRG